MGKLNEESRYQKWQKEANLGKFSKLYQYMYRVVPIHPQHKLNCIGTGPSCTGTALQNANYTDTGPSCTDTGVPKMPRMLYSCIIKLKFTHRSHRNLTK